MSSTTLDSIEIPAPALGRRRRFTVAEKRRFLAEASRPGETVSSVGRRYGLSVSLLFRWRRQIEGANARRTAVRVTAERDDVNALRARLVELERQLALKGQEIDQLRLRLNASAGPEPAALRGPRPGAALLRDGEA